MTTPTQEDIFVIIPAFNEGPVLGEVLAEVATTGYQIVVIDDGSSDETCQIARKHTPHLLKHIVNRGVTCIRIHESGVSVQ